MTMERIIDRSFWERKKVLLTGHTGFKGSWMSIWLHQMGARVTGYSLPAPTSPSLYELAEVEKLLDKSVIGDITDFDSLQKAVIQADPEIIIHMAAQPLVRRSYENPLQTYMTNVMGTANLMEAARASNSVRVILNITTDKCYENQEWEWGYRENDSLGGYDPYSSSKACSEFITSAYRRSFFNSSEVRVATARAGNVIGGGDWAEDRLVPDLIKSLMDQEPIVLRNPDAVRPWQHVLEPLSGYLVLCERLYNEGQKYADSWNFGPRDSDAKTVEYIVKAILGNWPGRHPGYKVAKAEGSHEASMLKLDCSKAHKHLQWSPRWTLETALNMTMDWFIQYRDGKDVREICELQINKYDAVY